MSSGTIIPSMTKNSFHQLPPDALVRIKITLASTDNVPRPKEITQAVTSFKHYCSALSGCSAEKVIKYVSKLRDNALNILKYLIKTNCMYVTTKQNIYLGSCCPDKINYAKYINLHVEAPTWIH